MMTCHKVAAVVIALVVRVAAFLVVFDNNGHLSTHLGKLSRTLPA